MIRNFFENLFSSSIYVNSIVDIVIFIFILLIVFGRYIGMFFDFVTNWLYEKEHKK